MEMTIRRRSNYVRFTVFIGSYNKLAPGMGATKEEQLKMISKKIGLGAACIAAIATIVLVTGNLNANAQLPDISKAGQLKDAATGLTDPLKGVTKSKNAKEITLTGRVVDFHCFMTGQMPSADVAKCTSDCIRSGVPVGLETSQGLIVLGTGMKSPVKTLLPFAQQTVEVSGKLFENGGVRYLDVLSIEASDDADDEEDDETAADED